MSAFQQQIAEGLVPMMQDVHGQAVTLHVDSSTSREVTAMSWVELSKSQDTETGKSVLKRIKAGFSAEDAAGANSKSWVVKDGVRWEVYQVDENDEGAVLAILIRRERVEHTHEKYRTPRASLT